MLRTALVLFILVPGFFYGLRSRLGALLLYLWFAFFRPQEFAWSVLNNFRLSYVLGLLVILPSLLTGVFPNLSHPLSIGALLFLLTGLVAQQNAINPPVGWLWVENLAQLMIVSLLAINIIKSPRDWIRTLAVPAVCLGFYGAKAGLYSVLSGGSRFGLGLSGSFADSNAYAVGMVMTMPLLWAVGRNATLLLDGFPKLLAWATKVFLYVSVPLCCYTVISTFSRGGFIALAAAYLAFLALQQIRKAILVVVAIVVLLPMVVPFLPEGYLDRLATIRQLQEDVESPREDVTEGRFHVWGVAIDMVRDYPLGIGMRQFQTIYPQYDPLSGAYGMRRDVHSSHFQALAEHGFAGAAVWIFLNGYSLLALFRVRKRASTPGLSPDARILFKTGAEGLISSFVGFLVGGATISMALNDLTWLSFALVASLDLISVRMCAEVRTTVPVTGVAAALKPLPAMMGRGSASRFDSRV